MDKVSVSMLPEHHMLASGGPSSVPYSIEVMAKGRMFKTEKIYTEAECRLIEETWMPDDNLVAKFKDNAASILPAPKIDKAASLLLELEKVEDVSELMNYLAL
jgi:hypothetical protein